MIICITLEQTDSHTLSLQPKWNKRVCIMEWSADCTEKEKQKKSHKRNKIIDQHLSSVSCTSRYQSSAPVRLPHPAGCGCVSVADADLVLDHQSPSLPARPSWRHERLHLLGATQPKIFFLLLMYVSNVALYTRHLYNTLYMHFTV